MKVLGIFVMILGGIVTLLERDLTIFIISMAVGCIAILANDEWI